VREIFLLMCFDGSFVDEKEVGLRRALETADKKLVLTLILDEGVQLE